MIIKNYDNHKEMLISEINNCKIVKKTKFLEEIIEYN